MNRIPLQHLASPGARSEQDDKVTQAIMAYELADSNGQISPMFESYLLRPATCGGVMREQITLSNMNGYGTIYAGQVLGPQIIRNPIKTVSSGTGIIGA